MLDDELLESGAYRPIAGGGRWTVVDGRGKHCYMYECSHHWIVIARGDIFFIPLNWQPIRAGTR